MSGARAGGGERPGRLLDGLRHLVPRFPEDEVRGATPRDREGDPTGPVRTGPVRVLNHGAFIGAGSFVGVTPAAILSVSESCAWVVDQGWMTRLLASRLRILVSFAAMGSPFVSSTGVPGLSVYPQTCWGTRRDRGDLAIPPAGRFLAQHSGAVAGIFAIAGSPLLYRTGGRLVVTVPRSRVPDRLTPVLLGDA